MPKMRVGCSYQYYLALCISELIHFAELKYNDMNQLIGLITTAPRVSSLVTRERSILLQVLRSGNRSKKNHKEIAVIDSMFMSMIIHQDDKHFSNQRQLCPLQGGSQFPARSMHPHMHIASPPALSSHEGSQQITVD